MTMSWVTLALLLRFGIIGALSDASDHHYKQDEVVPLYANKHRCARSFSQKKKWPLSILTMESRSSVDTTNNGEATLMQLSRASCHPHEASSFVDCTGQASGEDVLVSGSVGSKDCCSLRMYLKMHSSGDGPGAEYMLRS